MLTKMAAELQTLAKLLVFMLHIYRLTFPELLTAVQTTDPPLKFRISASLIDMSEYRTNCLVELCHDRSAMFTQISRVTSSSSVHSKPGLENWSRLILCGDILLNPGPRWQHPRGVCQKPVKKNQKGLQCDSCNLWYHTKCCHVNDAIYSALANHYDFTTL